MTKLGSRKKYLFAIISAVAIVCITVRCAAGSLSPLRESRIAHLGMDFYPYIYIRNKDPIALSAADVSAIKELLPYLKLRRYWFVKPPDLRTFRVPRYEILGYDKNDGHSWTIYFWEKSSFYGGNPGRNNSIYFEIKNPEKLYEIVEAATTSVDKAT
jgi:hypothetical protein